MTATINVGDIVAFTPEFLANIKAPHSMGKRRGPVIKVTNYKDIPQLACVAWTDTPDAPSSALSCNLRVITKGEPK